MALSSLRSLVTGGSSPRPAQDRKSTRLNSSHANISYAVFCLKKKKKRPNTTNHNNSNARLSLQKEHRQTSLEGHIRTIIETVQRLKYNAEQSETRNGTNSKSY